MISDRKILSLERFENIGLCVVLPVYLSSEPQATNIRPVKTDTDNFMI